MRTQNFLTLISTFACTCDTKTSIKSHLTRCGFLLCNQTYKGSEHMIIYERLDDATRKALGAKKPVVYRRKQHNNRKNVKYTEHELLELMGCNRDTYKRVNGKVKRK